MNCNFVFSRVQIVLGKCFPVLGRVTLVLINLRYCAQVQFPIPCRSVSADINHGLEADNAPLLQSRKLMGLDKIGALLSKKKTIVVVRSTSRRIENN